MREITEIRLIEFFHANRNCLIEKDVILDRFSCSETEIALALNNLRLKKLVLVIEKGDVILYKYNKPEYTCNT